jgi:hypothetical protein
MGSNEPHNSSYPMRKGVLRISACVWTSVGRGLYLDVSSVFITSNNEAVALSACTISVVGSILKSAADQIGALELIAP